MADQNYDTLSDSNAMKMMAEGLKHSSETQDVTQSPIFKEVMVNLGADKTVLDIGAGVGRYTIPLALAGCNVTAIEPSPEMISHLTEALTERDVSRCVDVVQSVWPLSHPRSAEVALATFVIQFSKDWVAFARAMEAAATNRCILALHVDPIMAFMEKLWPMFHPNKPIRHMPGFTEIYPALLTAGIIANVKVFEEHHGPRWKSAEEALPVISDRLGIGHDTEAIKQLEGILRNEAPNLANPRPHRVAMVSWTPTPHVVS